MDKIRMPVLREMAEAGVIRHLDAVAEPTGGYTVRVQIGMVEKVLFGKDAKEPRNFRTLDTLARYVRKHLGVAKFSVDATQLK